MSHAGDAESVQQRGNVEGMRGIISAVVASLAGCDVAEGTPLAQAGLDSLAFVELRNELSRFAKNFMTNLLRDVFVVTSRGLRASASLQPNCDIRKQSPSEYNIC